MEVKDNINSSGNLFIYLPKKQDWNITMKM